MRRALPLLSNVFVYMRVMAVSASASIFYSGAPAVTRTDTFPEVKRRSAESMMHDLPVAQTRGIVVEE